MREYETHSSAEHFYHASVQNMTLRLHLYAGPNDAQRAGSPKHPLAMLNRSAYFVGYPRLTTMAMDSV